MKRTAYKDIPGYESLYRIYEDGKVWSYRHQKFLTNQKTKTGYVQLNLYKDKRFKNKQLHRWVYESFVGKITPPKQINHKDGNKLNNHISNLEVVTAKENTRHAWRTGLAKKRLGQETSIAKLTPEKVRKIKERFKDGKAQKEIAKEFEVHPSNISCILSGKTWNHVK